MQDGKPIGVISVRRIEVRPFSEKQISLLATFTDQAAIAVRNVRLFEAVQTRTRELTEALEQQTATTDVLQAISRSAFDLDTVLHTLIDSVARLCDTGPAQIWRRDGEVYRFAAGRLLSPEYEARERAAIIRPGRSSVVGRVALEGGPAQISDLWSDPEYERKEDARIGNIRSVLGVPLLRGGEVVGVFTAGRAEPKPYTDRQIALMETFADQAVIAIENARLFEEVQQRTGELARTIGELKALGEVSQAVNSTLDSKTVLETIVAKAVQLSHTDGGAIYVYDAPSGVFKLSATYGMDDALIAAISRRPITLKDNGIDQAVRRRAPYQIADLEQEPTAAAEAVLKAGFRSLLIVPLFRGEEIVGALVVRRRVPGAFSQATVDLMQTFAAQSAQAIQNARLFSEIEEKSRELEIASRHKSQFLANMSHELRTPLNSVLGFTEMLVDGLYGDLPEKAKATLGRVQANGRHLLGLINGVLDLSKIEAGKLALSIDDYIVGQIVKTVAAVTEPLARNKGLALSVEIAPDLPKGRGDERRLTQVLLNLAGNAVKFTDKGSVAISARRQEGCFEIRVEDTGPGIAPEHLARIFEEFQQVDDSNTRAKGGTGLGLAISRRIVELHGGKIGVESALGRGSTFRVEIPINAEGAKIAS